MFTLDDVTMVEPSIVYLTALSLVGSEYLYLIVSETMGIVNVKYTRSHAGMRVTSSATPSREDTLEDRTEARCPWWTPVGTPRRRDDYRMTRASTGAVTKAGLEEPMERRREGEGREPSCTRRSMKSTPAERRSAGKLTKGECARGSLSLSSPQPL